jgi:hypothetical protein
MSSDAFDPIEDLESLLGDHGWKPSPIDDLETLLGDHGLKPSPIDDLEHLLSERGLSNSPPLSPPSSQASSFDGDDLSYEERRSLPRDGSEVHEDAFATNVGAEWQRPSSYDAMESASELTQINK